MKTVKLTEKQLLKGRIREVGEVILVEDSFEGGVVISLNTDIRNTKEVADFVKPPVKPKEDDKAK